MLDIMGLHTVCPLFAPLNVFSLESRVMHGMTEFIPCNHHESMTILGSAGDSLAIVWKCAMLCEKWKPGLCSNAYDALLCLLALMCATLSSYTPPLHAAQGCPVLLPNTNKVSPASKHVDKEVSVRLVPRYHHPIGSPQSSHSMD